MRHCLLLLPLLLILAGCVDERMKRQASLLNVKTDTAAEEFKAAPTSDAKVEVAKAYFENAPAMTQVISDYLCGVKPAPVQTTGGLPNAVKGVGNKMTRFFKGKPVCPCE